jgi:cysteinyl-tRNA synthetase
MQELIQTLLEKGFAYTTQSGGVYFHVRSFPDYGKLSGRNIEDLQAGTRIDPDQDKRDPLDFALWKQAKQGEPSWDSPWGEGRPGWHIECSAMSQRYLGVPFDIHGGGQDLSFPHHENERAQSMAASGKEFVHYWIHNGFVKVKNEKMSKSLGNFVTIRTIYKDYLPEVLRFFLLSKHYRSPLDFTWESMQESEKALKRVYQAKLQLEEILTRTKWSNTELPLDFDQEFKTISQNWHKSLEDDLNTAAALGYAFNYIRLANRLFEEKKWRQCSDAQQMYTKIFNQINEMGSILGVFCQDSHDFLSRLREKKIERKAINVAYVEQRILERSQARQKKDFTLADTIREELLEYGVELQDTPQGTTWDIVE